jgi:hypothetical protein
LFGFPFGSYDSGDFDQIDRDIRSGMLYDQARRDVAWHNRRFADGHFDEYPTRPENAPGRRDDFRRTSRIMRRVVQALTGNLYKRDPQRALRAGEAATDWLSQLYRRNSMAAKWHKADQFTVIGDVAAFQFAGIADDEYPVKPHLWAADQLVVWLDPDDPLEPNAVATVDAFNAQRRLRLYTKDVVATYRTARLGPFQTAGGTAWEAVGSPVATPYRDEDGVGYLPFAFAHFEQPTTDFWTGGIGDYLRQINDFLNFRLDRLGDSIRFIERPIPIYSGVPLDWTPPADLKPGQGIKLPAFVASVGDSVASSNPTVSYLMPPLEYITADWSDLQNFIDHALETCGIPPGAIRMVGTADSGIAMMIEQAPLLGWAEQRRGPFGHYEGKAARMAARVACTQFRRAGSTPADWLVEMALEDDGLSLEWAPLYVQLPGPERDRADTFDLSMGWTSKIRLMMERDSLTREQAIRRLAQVQQDNADLAALGVDPASPQAPTDSTGADGGTDDGQQDPDQLPAD